MVQLSFHMLQAYLIEEDSFGASEVNIYTVEGENEDEVASIIELLENFIYF